DLVVSRVAPAGATSTFSHESAAGDHRLKEIQHSASVNRLGAHYAYETNPLSQISKITTFSDPNTVASQDSHAYDRLGRLIMKSRSRPGTPGAGIGYNLLDFDE